MAKTGEFFGVIKTRWLSGHPRDMRLMETVRFTDPRGESWYAYRDSIINGASTGWFFRRLFPAYVGFYRRASVFHDAYCAAKTRPSWMVHRMFREAMLTDGTHPVVAWIMWLPVRVFGPRFK